MDHKEAKFTKSGPGRKHSQGNGRRGSARGFADTYLAACATKRRESAGFIAKHPRDKQGRAITLTGRDPWRRIDLATGKAVRRIWGA